MLTLMQLWFCLAVLKPAAQDAHRRVMAERAQQRPAHGHKEPEHKYRCGDCLPYNPYTRKCDSSYR